MELSTTILFFISSICGFLILPTHQLQSSQTQVLLQLRKHLEYPNALQNWLNPGLDLCFSSSPQANISCQDNIVTEIRIFGDTQTRPSSFNGSPIPNKTLSQNFSMDSLIATLSRLNSLRVLTLVSLGIWGPIPDKIHRLQSLESLDLSWNFFYGSVPQSVSRLGNLHLLKLDGNFLNGTFPDWFDLFSNLTSLSLRNNFFTGPLPISVRRTVSLIDINLAKNAISGKLMDLSPLSSLKWLDLSDNRFESELPDMPNGVLAVLLRNNSFSGRIPDQFSKLNQLQQLDLSSNALTGPIPEQLFTFPNISNVNLASNYFSGSIPTRLKCNDNLVSIDISNNRLVGLLPSCLSSNNAKASVVKFSGNCLSVDLRHQHPETYCAKNQGHENASKSHRRSVGILIGVIVGIAVVVVVLGFGFIVLCRQYCPRGSSEQHLLHKAVQDNSVTGYTAEILTNARFISDTAKLCAQGSPPHRLFSMDEVNAATNNFDKSALMGEGSTGKMYKGRLENGVQVAIRCLTVSKRYTIRNLKLRLDLLAKLRHPHLVCLMGHCIETQGKDESGSTNNVYLIYEYVPNGNYRAHLSETDPEKMLRWSDRLAILMGIAKAVHFLHTGVIPGFFSNRLKTNNILLNEHHMGKLSDYGLSVVAQELEKDREQDNLKTWQMKSQEDDIYSFGCILLESLVGPSVCQRKESYLLNDMVSLGSPEGQRRIVDPIVLASCCQESLSIVVSLTTNCISPELSTRPSFEDILWNLQYAAQVQATGDPKTGKTP